MQLRQFRPPQATHCSGAAVTSVVAAVRAGSHGRLEAAGLSGRAQVCLERYSTAAAVTPRVLVACGHTVRPRARARPTCRLSGGTARSARAASHKCWRRGSP
jgi:hypothetical protein